MDANSFSETRQIRGKPTTSTREVKVELKLSDVPGRINSQLMNGWDTGRDDTV